MSTRRSLRATRERKLSKSPVSVLMTMTAVGGMFAVVALPAYAVTQVEPTAAPISTVGTQSLAVQADVVNEAADRDGYKATTRKQLEEQRAAEVAAAWAASRVAGDDYPFRGREGLSPMNYYMGECTDFVAWRLNRDAGSTGAPFKFVWANMTPGGGNAGQWESNWRANGWKVSDKPIAGAVAVTASDHVAYVKKVDGDKVLLEEYNYAGYHDYGQRTIDAGSAIAYLYPPG